MKPPIGSDLSGWHIEKWHELRFSADEHGGYFPTAMKAVLTFAFANTKIERGRDSDNTEIKPVYVLTRDGKTGYLISTDEYIALSDEDTACKKIIEKSRNKLSPNEKILSGL